jgi:hypothetical protein
VLVDATGTRDSLTAELERMSSASEVEDSLSRLKAEIAGPAAPAVAAAAPPAVEAPAPPATATPQVTSATEATDSDSGKSDKPTAE